MATLTIIRSDIFIARSAHMDLKFMESACTNAEEIDTIYCANTRKERAVQLIKGLGLQLGLSDARINLAINVMARR